MNQTVDAVTRGRCSSTNYIMSFGHSLSVLVAIMYHTTALAAEGHAATRSNIGAHMVNYASGAL